MSQIIDVPGHGLVSFPDEMDDASIVAAIKKLVPPQQPQATEQPQETPRQPVSVPPEQLEPLNLTRTQQFKGDVYRGVKQLEQIGFGLGGLVADAVGLDSLAETALDKYAKVGEEANRIPRKIQDWTQIRSPKDLLDYSVQFIGEQLPMAIPSLVTGGAGGLIMRQAGEKAAAALVKELTAKGIAKEVALKTAAQALAKQTAKGALIGAAPSAVGLEAGSIYGDIAEKTGQRAPGTAAVFGTLAGALDVIPSMLLLNKIVGPAVGHEVARGLARRVGAAAAEQILSEGLTEGAQTVLERYAVQKIDPNQRTFSKEGVIEIVDAMLGGAIVGGTMGAGGGAIEHYRQPKAKQAAPAELPADEKAKLDAARIEREDKLNSPAPDFRAVGTRALPIPEEEQPLVSDFVGRTIDSDGTPIGTIVGADKVGLIVHYKGRNQPTVLPYESVGLKPGVNVRLEAKPAPSTPSAVTQPAPELTDKVEQAAAEVNTNQTEPPKPESVTPVTQTVTTVAPKPKEANAVQEQVPAANDVRPAPANSEAMGQGNAQDQGSPGESPAQKQESGSPPRKVGVRRKPQQQTEVTPNEKDKTKEGLPEVTSHGDAGGVIATAQPASQPPPVEKTEAIIPPPEIKQGDWVDYKDSYGVSRQGRVNSVMVSSKIVPTRDGIKTAEKRTEYVITDGKGNYLPSPASGSSVTKIEAPVAQPQPEAQVKPEVTNETGPTGPTGTSGQSMENPSPLDVRPPTEPSPQPSQAGDTGQAPGPEVSASPASSPGPKKEGSGGKRGVRRGDVGSPGATGNAKPGEPAAANTGSGTAEDNSGTAGVTAPPEGQRAHIVRLLDMIENRREQEDLPPGYKQSLVDALKERLKEIETEMLNKVRGVKPQNESLSGWDSTEPGTDQKFLAPDEVKAAIENEPMLDGVGFEVVNVPEMRSVAGAFGYNSQGRPVMFLNAAGITSPEQAVEVLREEQGHALLSTPEGRQKVLAFADERMTEEERKDLMGTYAQRPGESSEAYRERLANEFIAKSGRQKNGFWRELIERLKAWFAERGLGTLTNEQAARAILRKLSRDVDAGVLTPGSLPSDAAKESLQPISSKGEFNKLTASENLMHPTDALFQAQLFGSQNQAAIGHMVGAFNALAPEVQAVLPTISGRMDVIELSRNAAQRISGAPWTPPSGDLATMAGQFSSEPWAQAMFVSLAQNEMMNIQAETDEHMKETAKAAAEAKAALKAERKRLPLQRMGVLANEIINFRRGQLLAERASSIQSGDQVAEAAADAELGGLQDTAAAVVEVIKAILANVSDALIRSPLTPREDIMKAWAAKRPGAVIAASPEIIDSVEKTLAQMPDLNVRLDAISHPEKSLKVQALEKRAATLKAGLDFLQALLNSPEFRSNYQWAIDKTGSRALVAKENADHNLSWDNPMNPEESVTLRPGFSDEDYRHNVKALQTAKAWFEAYLDPQKNPNPDLLKAAGIQVQLWAIDNVHLSQQFNPQTGKLLGGGANAFDFLIRAAGGIMDVPDYIVELSGGAPAAASIGALNNYAEAQRETQKADNRLSTATSKAVLAAAKEHGMDVATWLTEIGDEISGSYQNIGTPRVRAGDKVLGHTVTQADIDAVQAQKAYVDGITASARKSLETPSGAPAPIKIRDVVGTTGFEREAQPTSELTVPQRPTANAFGFVDDWNAIKKDGTMTDRQKLAAWERLLNGKFFRQGLVGHVRSFDDPQYASAAKSPFRSDYVNILRDINSTGVVPFRNLDDLADIIFAAQQSLPVAQQMTQLEIKGKIVREINGAVDRFSDENRGEKMMDLDKSKVSVISAENFMNRPRGKRALPKTFYTYTVGTKAEQDQIRFHVLEVFGQRLLNAVQAQLDAVTKQLSEWSQAIKEEKLTEEQIREDQKAGKNFLNYSEAVTVRANLERFLEAFRTYTLRNMGQEFRLYQWPNILRGTVANAMLQRAPTLLANYLGAAFQKALLDATVMRAGKSFLLRFAPVGAAYASAKSIAQHGLQTVNAAVGMILNQPEVSPRMQALASYIRANQGFFSKFAGMVTDYAERQRARVAALKESGILEDDPWRYNLDALKSMPTMGGRLSSERRGPTGKALELLKTAILLANETGVGLQLPRAMGVSAIESFNNAMSDKATTDILHDLLMFSGRSFSTRQANGYDPLSSILTPEEIFGRPKASAADAAQLRQMFARAGLNMDRVLIEHWQAVQNGAQRTLEDTLGAQGKAALMREVAKWLNKGGFANRPFYNSSLGRFAGLFFGYGINQNAQLARLMASYSKDNRNALWRNLDHFETAVVMFVLLSLFGAAFQPAAGWLKRFFYNEEHPVRPIWKSRNLTEAFLTDLQNMANSMPLLGRVFVNTLGAATPGTQLGMFGMQLFPVSAGNTLMQAFSKGWQTGDWGRVGVELMRNFIPNSRVWLNRISSRQGLTNETAMRNILSANAPTGVELNSNPYQTGTVRYSPARAHIDDVVNALSRPEGVNMAEVRTAREAGIAALVAAGKSRDDAARAFDASIMSRNPFLAVYGRNLTQTEMAELRSSVSPEQLTQIDAVVKGRQAYAREFGLTEPDYIRDAGARSAVGAAGASDMVSAPARAAGVLGVRRGAMGGGTGIGAGRLPNPMAERASGTPRVGGIGQISETMPKGTGITRISTVGRSSRGLRTRRIRTGRRIGIRRGKMSGRVKNSKRIRLRRR